MLVSVVGRYAEQGQREVDRYAAWSAALAQFRSDWREGKRPAVPQLRDYLREVPQDHRTDTLQDLIAEHLRLTWQAGQGTFLEAYIQEFGQEFVKLASPSVVPADLVEDEFLARYVSPHGDTPPLDEYERRFSSRIDVMEPLRARCLDGGRYVKLRKRAQGAMGEVWAAHDRRLRRAVAIKEPRRAGAVAGNSDMLRRFSEEARLTATLEHPGIVSVHEYYQPGDGVPFYVMRLVSGQTLGEGIRDYHQPCVERTAGEERILWNDLLHSFVKVCDAVAYAHSRGVLHRDLKPGNVVVGEFGESVILDWGMGKGTGDHPSHTAPVSEVLGTPDYMPPEQAEGVADARSDVFGLGAILYEVLTGRAPHAWGESARPADWLRVVREAQFPPPCRLNPQSPHALEAICLKALARNPADRYQTAAELAEDMRRYLAGEPVSAWMEPFSARVRRWFGRSRP